MEEALQITQIIVNVVIIFLFLGIVVMIFKLLKQTKKLGEKFGNFSNDFKDIKPKVIETLDKINFLADNLNSVVTTVNENVEVLGAVVDKFKDTAENILEFEKKIQDTIEPPVMETLNTVSAVSAGVKTFIDTWKQNKVNGISDSKRNHGFDETNDIDVSIRD